MSKRKFISLEDFSLPSQAVDLVKESVREGIEFDAFGDRQTFTAMALTEAVVLTKVEASGYGAATDGLNLGTGLRHKFKARILDEDSPHLFLPDPCALAESGDGPGTMSAIARHTDFIQINVQGNKVSAGDIVEVTMRKNIFSYDLQVGVFNRILAFNSAAESMLKDAGCATLAASFDFKHVQPIKITSLDTGDITDVVVTRNNKSTIIGPNQHGYLTALAAQMKQIEAAEVVAGAPPPDGGYIKKIVVTDGVRDGYAFAEIIRQKVEAPGGWDNIKKLYTGKNGQYIIKKLYEVKDRTNVGTGADFLPGPWATIIDDNRKKKIYLSLHQLNLALDIGTTDYTDEQVQFLARAAESLGSTANPSNYATRKILGEPVGGYWKHSTTSAIKRAGTVKRSDEHLHIEYALPTGTT
jgi:hypothetical protein